MTGDPDASSGRRYAGGWWSGAGAGDVTEAPGPARRVPGPVLNGRRGSLRQVYVMHALRKPEGRSVKGRAGQGPIMGHYRTGRDARPGTEWGAPALALPAGLPQISTTLPAACRWLPGAIRPDSSRGSTSGGRWAAGRGSWAVGGSLGGRVVGGRPLAGPRASGVTGAHRAPGAVGGKAQESVRIAFKVEEGRP